MIISRARSTFQRMLLVGPTPCRCCLSEQVVEAESVLLRVDEMALGSHLKKLGIGYDWKLLMQLASYEKVPQAPPGPYDAATPAPKLITPLASVMLKNRSDTQDAGAAVAGVVEDLPAAAEMNIVGVSRLDAGDGMLVKLPRLSEVELFGFCNVDNDCKGVTVKTASKLKSSSFVFADDSSRRRLADDEYVFPGTCVQNQCACPLPWTGNACEEIFECLWWDPEQTEWADEGCTIDASLSTNSELICNCSLVGSADVQVVVRQVIADPFTITFHTFSFDDVKYFGSIGDNFMPIVVIGVLDTLFILGFVTALVRSNERRIRKYDRHYQFWRAQHSLRAGQKKSTWKKRTWTQLKAQHKLLRVFYQQFELGEDPIRLHTGAQKLMVLYIIILFKMTISSMLSQLDGNSGIQQTSVMEGLLRKVLIGVISSCIALPASVFLDQMFWKQQRVTNAKKKHDTDTTEVQLMARAAIHSTMSSMDEQWALMMWRLAIEELRVSEMREKLLASRHGRLAVMQDSAAAEKLYLEQQKVIGTCNLKSRVEAQFTSLVAKAQVAAGKVERLEQEQASIEKRRSDKKTELGTKLQLLRRSKNPVERNQLEKEIRDIEDNIEKFDEDEKLLVQQVKDVKATSAGAPSPEQVIDAAATRIQQIFKARQARKRDAARVLSTQRIARSWRNRIRNEKVTRGLDSIIETETVRVQRAFRLHAYQRLSVALQLQSRASKQRPAPAPPKNGKIRVKVVPTEHAAVDVDPPHLWFVPLDDDQAHGSNVRWANAGSSPPPSPPANTGLDSIGERCTSSTVPTALPGALASTGRHGFNSLVQPSSLYEPHEKVSMRKDDYPRCSSSPESSGLLISRSGTGSTSRSIAMSDIALQSKPIATPLPVTYASPELRLKRRLAFDGPDGGRTLAARAHILATRAAAWQAWHGQKVAIKASVPVIVQPEVVKHVPLVYDSFENVRAVDLTFRLWREWAVVPVSFFEEPPVEPAAASPRESLTPPQAAAVAPSPRAVAFIEPLSADQDMASPRGVVAVEPLPPPAHPAETSSFLSEEGFAQFFLLSDAVDLDAQEAIAVAKHNGQPAPNAPFNTPRPGTNSTQQSVRDPLRVQVPQLLAADITEVTAESEAASVASGGSGGSAEGEDTPLTPRSPAQKSSRPRFALGTTAMAKGASVRVVRAAGVKVKSGASAFDKGFDKAVDKVAEKTMPGPVKRCYSALCKSVIFWRAFPWTFCLLLIVVCHFQTLFVTMRIFAQFPNANDIGLTWLQAILISLATGWFLQDPLVIITRNNMSCTKKIIRNKKYQVIEKFIVIPFSIAIKSVVAGATRLLTVICG